MVLLIVKWDHFFVEKIIDDYYGGIFNLTKYQFDTIIMIISKKERGSDYEKESRNFEGK